MNSIFAASLAAATLAGSSAVAATTTPPAAWTVLRLTVSRHGDLESMRVAYHSGDASFDRTAFEAVSKTRFVPARDRTVAATIDYVVLRDENGERSARILPSVSAPRTIAWRATASD